MQFDLFDPVLNVIKTVSLIDSVSEDDTHGSSIISLGDCFELLLSGSIPNLQTDSVLANHDGFGFEVDADGGEVRCHKIVLAVFEEHVCLADPTIANNQQFDEAIVALIPVT